MVTSYSSESDLAFSVVCGTNLIMLYMCIARYSTHYPVPRDDVAQPSACIDVYAR